MIILLRLSAILVFFAPVCFASTVPEFAEPITNVTAAVGREAVLECTVENLGTFKVAWIKLDTETLLTIHTHVISRDERLRVSHNNYRQWYLHIRDVRVEDRGYYMCQINTEPMTSQSGYLDVLVPPKIIEQETSSDTVTEERSRASLKCKASGYPPPTITWRRENGKEINLGTFGGKRHSASKVEGDTLNLTQVTRDDMGAYLCIASNGIPPSVSKRILLQVNFHPKIRVPDQLVGAAVGTDVVLECRLEASPRPLTSWIRNDGVILLNNQKYQVTEEEDSFRIQMKLRILNLEEKDFGSYKCVAKNTLGEKEGLIRLYGIPGPTSLPKSTVISDVAYPILKNLHNDSYSARKGYGIPSTNSLMDESQGYKSNNGDSRRSRLDEEYNSRRSLANAFDKNHSSSPARIIVPSLCSFVFRLLIIGGVILGL